MNKNIFYKKHTAKTGAPTGVLVGVLLSIFKGFVILALIFLTVNLNLRNEKFLNSSISYTAKAEGVYTPVNAVIHFTCLKPRDLKDTTYSICIKTENSAAPLPQKDTVLINKSGEGSFKIEITEPGTFVYRVYQEKGNDKDVKYDDTQYDIYVYVTSDEKDRLSYMVSVNYADTDVKPISVSFENESANGSPNKPGDDPENPSVDTSTRDNTEEPTEDPGKKTTEQPSTKDTSSEEPTSEEPTTGNQHTTEKPTNSNVTTTEQNKPGVPSGADGNSKLGSNARTGDDTKLVGLIMTLVISIIGIMVIVGKKHSTENYN